MKVEKEILVNKPVNDVWEILGKQYTDAYKWASGLYYSEGSGEPSFEGASCSNRDCDTSFGQLREEIQVFDEKQYKLSYEVVEGFPSFIEKGVNNWSLTPVGTDQTKVSMRFDGKTRGLMGLVMGPMMGMKLGSGLQNAIEEFKHYVETGEAHPRKIKDIQKQNKKKTKV